MQDLIQKIEDWANARNIINGTKPIDQAMKLFSEFGELADNVGKGRDCRDDIGDVFVVLVIMAKQCDVDIFEALNGIQTIGDLGLKEAVCQLMSRLHTLVDEECHPITFRWSINALKTVCKESNNDLQECVQLAYDDIKDGKGIISNGVFIKESDPVYAQVIAEIEGNFDVK